MFRFASLGSGSKGNATLVQVDDTLILVDCGYSAAEAARRMQSFGVDPSRISAILVTHEHGDHIRGVPVFSRRHRIPVYLTHGTKAGCRDSAFHACHTISPHSPFQIDNLKIFPYPVPHDAREPCQFVFDDGRYRLGLLTDAGSITAHMVEALKRCDALMLECNYDPQMLARGPYPPALQRRIADRYGHLANHQAAELLSKIDAATLRCLRAMHLSEKNNSPDLVRETLCSVLDPEACDIHVASQENGFHWSVLA